jgi:hypothetical protein
MCLESCLLGWGQKRKEKGAPTSSTVIFWGKTFAAFPHKKVGFKFDYVFFLLFGKICQIFYITKLNYIEECRPL